MAKDIQDTQKIPQLNIKDIFQIADSYCESALLQHAHIAGIFDILQQPRSAKEIANIVGWVEFKTTIFLDALVALGLVYKTEAIYRNSDAANRALVKDRPGYIGDLIEHERLQWNLWGKMGEVLVSNEAIAEQQDLNLAKNVYANTVFHRAMMQLAGELLGIVTGIPEWNERGHVLDLAGGHGLYLAELVMRYPFMTGEIWDMPSARQQAESLLIEKGVEDRVKFVERNISDRTNFKGVSADAAMLNHCLHHFDLTSVDTIVRCIADILPVGGLVTILDVHLEESRVLPTENALFSLYMMVNTARGQVHPTNEIARILELNGFDIERRLLDSLEGDFLMIGRKR